MQYAVKAIICQKKNVLEQSPTQLAACASPKCVATRRNKGQSTSPGRLVPCFCSEQNKLRVSSFEFNVPFLGHSGNKRLNVGFALRRHDLVFYGDFLNVSRLSKKELYTLLLVQLVRTGTDNPNFV